MCTVYTCMCIWYTCTCTCTYVYKHYTCTCTYMRFHSITTHYIEKVRIAFVHVYIWCLCRLTQQKTRNVPSLFSRVEKRAEYYTRRRQKVCPAKILSLTTQDDGQKVCPADLLENPAVKRRLAGRTLCPSSCIVFRHSRKTETARCVLHSWWETSSCERCEKWRVIW